MVIGHKIIRESSNFLAIGNNSDGATWFPYNGQIEEVRLWNAALDSVTLSDWMHKQLNGNHPFSSNLVAYWQLNEGTGATATDSSGNGNNGSLISMDTTAAWFVSTAPLATGITETLNRLSAVWISKDSSASSIMSIEDNNIVGDEDVIFGHDNAGLGLINSDVPAGLGIRQRLNRIWRMEVYGQLSGDIIFDVRNIDITDGNQLWLLIDADGVFSDADTAAGTFNPSDSTFIVSNLNLQHGYYYTLGTTENPVSVEPDITGIIPENLMLEQNYPNPFNPSTTIEFSIPESGWVTLKVYDLSGSEVTTLVSKNLSAGSYKYNWNASDLASGAYFYQLKLGSFNKIKKLLLLR